MKYRVNKADGAVEVVDASAAQIGEDGSLQFGKIGDDGKFAAEGPSFPAGEFVSYAEGGERPVGTNADGTTKNPQPDAEEKAEARKAEAEKAAAAAAGPTGSSPAGSTPGNNPGVFDQGAPAPEKTTVA